MKGDPRIMDLQIKLNDAGFGPLNVDGDFGNKTIAALLAYEESLRNTPLAPIPWWRSSGMRSILGMLAGLAVLFSPELAQFDFNQIINIIFNISGHIEEIVVLIGTGITLFSASKVAKGRINATQPIDPRQVTPNFRLPFDVVRPKRVRNSNVSSENNGVGGAYWSNDNEPNKGPFNES